MMELTASQQKALDDQIAGHSRVVDPRTGQVYYLVPAEVYDWLYSFVEDEELKGINVGLLIEKAMREDDAEDPTLESYQEDKSQP